MSGDCQRDEAERLLPAGEARDKNLVVRMIGAELHTFCAAARRVEFRPSDFVGEPSACWIEQADWVKQQQSQAKKPIAA